MDGFRLTTEEIRSLRGLHRHCKDRQLADRIKAVVPVGTGTVVDTAEALLLDEDTIRSYRQAYQQGGTDLLLTVRYQGSDSKLSPDQLRELDQHLSATTYLRAQDVVAYVQETFGVVYTVAAYGWIKRGTNKTIESNTGRSHVNINGAVDVARLQVVEFGAAVNAQSTIALLRKPEARHPKAKTIYVYCDNARYYRSRPIQACLAGSKIKLLFLPTYCPNLNLIERLWKYFRKQVLYNHYYEHFAEFQAACEGFFQSLQKHATALRRLLTENFQVITP